MKAPHLRNASHLIFLRIALFAIAVFHLWPPSTSLAAAGTRLKTPSGIGVSVNADEMFRDSERQIIELKGNVQVLYDQQYIACDRALIYLQTQEIEAEGSLVISSPTAYVQGDRAVISYKDNTGTILNGLVKSGQVIFEGSVVRKTGPETYEAESASYTACTTCPTAWTFSGSLIKAEIGGYAYIKQSVLRIADFPVFWLPYLIVPLKSERQTGLLIPTFDFGGSGGFAPGLHYFWAISRSQDLTISTKYYELRGWKGVGNFRYMLSQDSSGSLSAGLLAKDNVFKKDLETFSQSPEVTPRRWFLTYDHAYELPHGFIQRTKLNYASDLLYPRDFPDEIGGLGDAALENRVTLTKNTERSHASVDVGYYINQIKQDPVDSNRDAVHRFPELRYSLTDRPIMSSGFFSGLFFSFNSNYVNFAREDFAFDDVDVDPTTGTKVVNSDRTGSDGGVFNPMAPTPANKEGLTARDVIRSGQRVDLTPEVSYPIKVGSVIDILPTAQFRHTQYSFNVATAPGAFGESTFDTSPYRQYLRGKISTRTRFSRIFGSGPRAAELATVRAEAAARARTTTDWVDAESRTASGETPTSELSTTPPAPIPAHNDLYRHEIEPEFAISGVPYFRQTKGSFFGKSDSLPSFLDTQPLSNSDFEADQGIQFDYEDRFVYRNTASVLIGNRLVRKSWVNGSPTYRQIANFKLGQNYDLDVDDYPLSEVSALLDVRLSHFETNTVLRYFPYHNKTNSSSRIKIMDDSGRFFQISVAQTFLITLASVQPTVRDIAYDQRSENIGFAAGFDSKYVSFYGGIDYKPVEWSPADSEVKSWSTILNFKPPGDCWGIRTIFREDIGGQKFSWKVEFDYKFGGASTI